MRSLPYDRTKMQLSKIVQQYKAAVARDINDIPSDFQWQKSFYDHIIRNEKSLHRIQKYFTRNESTFGLLSQLCLLQFFHKRVCVGY